MTLGYLASLTGGRVAFEGMRGRGLPSKRENAESHHTTRIQKVRFSIYRHDGVLLGGSPSLESAHRIAGVISMGQRKGYAEVRAR